MNLLVLRRVLVGAMMGLAFLALQLSGELSPAVIALFWPGWVASWFWDRPRIDFARFEKPWTWATIAVFVFTLVDVFVIKEFFLISTLNFLLFLATAKLFQLAEDKDYTQSMALSLMLIAAGSVLNDSLSFGACFAGYVLVATVGLTVQHLANEATLHAPERRRSQKMENAIFATTVGLGIAVFAGSVLFFYAFPRIGVGAFMSQNRRGISSSGFGENVELGSHGTIREDSTVVMRVVFPDGPPMPVPEIHWRGLSLDHYNGHSWSDLDDDRINVVQFLDGNGFGLMRASSSMTWEELTAGTVRAEINLEPIESDVLFSIGMPRALSLPNTISELPSSAFGRAITADDTGEVELDARGQLGKRYIVYSYPNLPVENELRDAVWFEEYPDLGAVVRGSYVDALAAQGQVVAPPDVLTEEVYAVAVNSPPINTMRGRWREDVPRYLQIPDGQITARMRALTDTLRASNPSQYAYTVALERWLKDNVAYTTDLPMPTEGQNLVDAFLFEWQRGHCEYFATAMVLLLRSQGIPARIVNGFLGGDYNEIGQYYAVRQANAHSWVEVHFPGTGWVQFDPTPAGPVEAGPRGWFRRASLLLDSARLAWFRWVIEYDVEKQYNALQGLAARLGAETDANGRVDTMAFAEKLRGVAFWFFRNLEALFSLLVTTIAGTLFYRRRNIAGQAWDRADDIVFVAWCIVVVATVMTWWDDGTPLVGYLLGLTPAVLVYGLSRLLRTTAEGADEVRQRRRAASHAVSALYVELLKRIEAEDIALGAGITPGELPSRLPITDRDLLARLQRFLDFYQQARFAGQTVNRAQIRYHKTEMRALAKALRAALRAQQRSGA